MKKYTILEKKKFSSDIFYMNVYAPRIAKSAQPGQFLIVIPDEKGERIPLTIVDYDRNKGSVAIVIQTVGLSTAKINSFNVGNSYYSFAGPLGNPSELIYMNDEELQNKNILFIGGGVGIAPIYPQVKYLYNRNFPPDVIIAAKTAELLIFKNELENISKNLFITTDDGSEGFKGFAVDLLKKLIETENKKYDLIIAIGPMIMMKSIADYTKKLEIKTIASLNTIMVDGTGMCGGCRITVGGKTKFTCVDGPEFDAHLINFDEAMKRNLLYRDIEKQKFEEYHKCKIGLK